MTCVKKTHQVIPELCSSYERSDQNIRKKSALYKYINSDLYNLCDGVSMAARQLLQSYLLWIQYVLHGEQSFLEAPIAETMNVHSLRDDIHVVTDNLSGIGVI